MVDDDQSYCGPERRRRRRPLGERIVGAMSEALFDSDLIATRLALALAELLWAVMLLWPGDTFARPTYAVLALAAPEEAWAALFLVTSFLQFSIVVEADYHGLFARYFAAWNAALWGFVVGAMLVAVYPPPAAIGGEIALSVSAFWIWIRPFIIAEGVRRADEQQRCRGR